MAKKYGKRRKSGASEQRDLFGAAAPPRPTAARPASSTPLADYLSANWPGVNEGYVVLPRSLAEAMSLPWQQQMAAMLSQFHQAHGGLNWPVYRVVPSRYENLVDLDEEQLAEAGYLVEIDADGDMVYRERSGRKVEDPENTTVLVSCLDPIPPRGSARAAEAAAEEPERPRAVPMIIPPAPVWRTTPTTPSASVPPLPEPPRKPDVPPTPSRGVPEQTGVQERARVEERATSPQAPVAPSVQAPAQAPAGPGPADRTAAGQIAQPSTQADRPSDPASGPEASAGQSVSPSAPTTEDPAPTTRDQARAPERTSPSQTPTQDPSSAWQPPTPQAPTQQTPTPHDTPHDEDTPPRGIPLSDRGWFDPLPGEESADEPADFGPTGDPTELPYRYRP